MSENTTLESIAEEDEGMFLYEDYHEIAAHREIMRYVELCYLPFLIVIGVPCSILVLTILIRRRLWIVHEAYIYLAAILIFNIYTLIFTYGDWWFSLIDHRLMRLSIAAFIVCKFWMWLISLGFHIDWLFVLLMLNVYLHLQQPVTSGERRGCCAYFAKKYCSLFGTKVIVSSCFMVCTLATFWHFSIVDLRDDHHDDVWFCFVSSQYIRQYLQLADASWWLETDLSMAAMAVLLLLIVWKRKRNSCFVSSQINGATEDNDDAETMARLVICCAVVALIIGASGFAIQVLEISSIRRLINNYSLNEKILRALHLIFMARPFSTQIVCLLVKSRFRDDLKTMVERCYCRCCPVLRLPATLRPASDNHFSSVLQLYPVDEDSSVTGKKENSEQIPIQM